jgi:hypothetical protein
VAGSEQQEHLQLEHALQAISDWLRPGTNEGANFLVTRLAGPISDGSFFGGADISRFVPGGSRGSLQSQGGTGYLLDFSGGTATSFTVEATLDLNLGKVTLGWTPPGQPAQSSSFTLEYVKMAPPPNGPTYFFDTETTGDQAVYSFTMVLL